MADPLGLAAGVAGLLSLTIQVIHIVNKFKDDVGSAKTEIVTLVRELVALKHILESLETGWREKKLPPDFESSALAGIQQACKTQLTILLDKLNKAAGISQSAPFFGIRRSVFYLKWPFEVEKTREVIENLHRYFSIFTWALHFHESEILFKLSNDACRILQDQEKLLDESRKVFGTLNETRNYLDAAINITSSVLKAIEGKLSGIDKKHEDFDTITGHIASLDLIEDTHKEVIDGKNAVRLIGEDIKKIRSEIVERYDREQHEAFLEKLPTLLYRKKHLSAFEGHQPGTCQWFLKSDRFTSWRNDTTPSLLVCEGIPGAGKTMIMALAIEDTLKASGADTYAAYVYCDYRNRKEETVQVILWSLLRQLMTPERLIFPFVRRRLAELCNTPKEANRKISTIVALIKILAGLSQKTFLFVDGIDEVAESDSHGRDVRQRLLTEIGRLANFCKIFVTCRPHINTESLCDQSHHQTIEVRAANDDIFTYVSSRISACKSMREFVKQDPTLKSKIIHTIQERSNGVFLLATFHISQLAAAVSPRNVLEILESLSKNLSDVYGSFWSRLSTQHSNRRNLAHTALSWVLASTRSLTDVELAHALSFKTGDSHLQPSDLIDISMIIEVCDGLLRLEPPMDNSQRPVVSLAHLTIAEFLSQTTGSYDVHLEIANTSLSYLGMKGVSTKDPFFSYADSAWAKHARLARGAVDHRLLLRFALNNPEPLAKPAWYGLDYDLAVLISFGFPVNKAYGAVSPLMLSASQGHTNCLSLLIKAGADVNFVGATRIQYNTALLCAISGGFVQSVFLLIKSGVNVDMGNIPPISAAVESGYCQIAEKLLTAGSNPNVRYRNKTPLFRALELENQAMSELLISSGADSNMPCTLYQETPLQLAIHRRQDQSAVLLLTKGADPDQITHTGLSPLQQAAYEGKIELVEVILQVSSGKCHSISMDPTLHISKSPLHLALESRSRQVAKHLIRKGIGVNDICGVPPYYPLEWAARQDDIKLVEELLRANADPNLAGEGIPLLSAASRFLDCENHQSFHNTEVIKLLLDAGANPQAHDYIFVEKLERCIDENIKNKWWRKSDPIILRLRISLTLPEDWVPL